MVHRFHNFFGVEPLCGYVVPQSQVFKLLTFCELLVRFNDIWQIQMYISLVSPPLRGGQGTDQSISKLADFVFTFPCHGSIYGLKYGIACRSHFCLNEAPYVLRDASCFIPRNLASNITHLCKCCNILFGGTCYPVYKPGKRARQWAWFFEGVVPNILAPFIL